MLYINFISLKNACLSVMLYAIQIYMRCLLKNLTKAKSIHLKNALKSIRKKRYFLFPLVSLRTKLDTT